MIVKSDKAIHVEYFLMIAGLLFLEIICTKNLVREMIEISLIIGLSAIMNLVIFWMMLEWIQMSKTIIMNSDGCIVKLWKIHKTYTWEEIKIKRIEKFYLKNVGSIEGIVFCKHSIFKPKWVYPGNFAFLSPFLSYFFVCFNEENDGKKKLTGVHSYVVNKDEFVEKMNLWNVELEDCRK